MATQARRSATLPPASPALAATARRPRGQRPGGEPPRITPAQPEHLDALVKAIQTVPLASSPLRTWQADDLRSWLVPMVLARYGYALQQPEYEILLHWQGSQVAGWVVLQHGTEEGATGRPQTTVLPPSYLSTPALLLEACSRARGQGSQVLTCSVLNGDLAQERCCVAAGLVAEFERIVLPLERYQPDQAMQRLMARALRATPIRRAEYSDRLTLIHLAAECAQHMFHPSRGAGELEAIAMRFVEGYASSEPDDPTSLVWIAESAEGLPCGALQVQPQRDPLPDASWQAYIQDLSVLPEQWGRGAGLALMGTCLETLRSLGTRYLAADISTANSRVWSLAQRLGFERESQQHVRLLHLPDDPVPACQRRSTPCPRSTATWPAS